jgi:hypothetical protein
MVRLPMRIRIQVRRHQVAQVRYEHEIAVDRGDRGGQAAAAEVEREAAERFLLQHNYLLVPKISYRQLINPSLHYSSPA